MNKVYTILAIILLMMAGCGGGRKSGSESDTFITVDVTANYPKKELILQDFMDVEYIALETTNEFVCQGIVRAIGEKYIVVVNSIIDGDIIIFDRNGKGLRKINRMGRGGEEYLSYRGIILDEDNEELFINDTQANKITVYDLYGTFKRSFRYVEGIRYSVVYNFDKESLICSDFYYEGEKIDNPSFFIISKQDGSIIKTIQIPFEQKKSMVWIQYSDSRGPLIPENIRSITIMQYFPIIPYHGSWTLMDPSSDTIFKFLPDYNLVPFIARTPSVQSMNPEVFLVPKILTDRYYFMKIIKKEADSRRPDLVYDRQERTIYEYIVFNNDFSTKATVDMFKSAINDEIAFCQKLEADDLFEAYEKGQLKGKLKDIAAKLKEEDNPVIMLVKHKK